VTIHIHDSKLPITMLAGRRLGVVHFMCFGGVQRRGLADLRAADSRQPGILIYADGYGGNGNGSTIKEIRTGDRNSEKKGQEIDKVLVCGGTWEKLLRKRRGYGARFFVDESLEGFRGKIVRTGFRRMRSATVFYVHSGTTANPRVASTVPRYLASAADFKNITGLHPVDVYCVMADSVDHGTFLLVYGPLALAATHVFYRACAIPGCGTAVADRGTFLDVIFSYYFSDGDFGCCARLGLTTGEYTTNSSYDTVGEPIRTECGGGITTGWKR